MKKRIVFFLIILCACTAFAFTEEYINEQIISQTIDSLEIEWLSDAVIVMPHNENTVKVVQTLSVMPDSRTKMTVHVNGRSLSISDNRDNHKNGWSWFGKQKYTTGVTVFVPTKYYTEIEIDTVSADIDLIDIEARFIDVESVSGFITMKNVRSDEINVDTVSGRVNASGVFRDIDVESVSGSVEFSTSEMPRSIRGESISGGMSFGIPENGGFTVRLSKVSGRLNSDFPFTVQSNDRYVYGSGSSNFSVETVSGSCNIYKNVY